MEEEPDHLASQAAPVDVGAEAPLTGAGSGPGSGELPASSGGPGPSEVWVHRAGVGRGLTPASAVQPLDFRNPAYFSPGGLRRMRVRHEEFVRALSARLSLYLRMEFSLQLGKLDTVPYRAFMAGLADPTHLTLFRIEPLPGICVVDVPSKLAMTIVDRLLGGPAQALPAEGEPSEIEIALLSQAVQVILSEWASYWSGTQELKALILGNENSGRFLRTSPHDSVMLVLRLNARLGECEESIQIAFPHYTIEPLILTLGQASEKATSGAPAVRTEKVAWNPRFADVPVTLTAEWEGVELTARELSNLKVGDVVPLDRSCVDEVTVRFADVPRFKGRLGSSGEKLAVELVTIWKQ